MRRRPRPAQRGPPAPARRTSRRHRSPRHHLRRPRRADQRRPAAGRARSASCSTSSTRTARVGDGSARGPGLVHHPLQPFDPRNFAPDALVAGQTWSFDAVALDGARAAVAGPAHEGSVPARAAGARRQLAGGARRPRPLRPAPGQGLPAPAPRGLGQRRWTTSRPTRCPSPSTASSGGAWAIGSSNCASPDPTRTHASTPKSHGAVCRRGRSVTSSSTACCRSSTTSSRGRHGRGRRRRATAESVEVERRPRRRPRRSSAPCRASSGRVVRVATFSRVAPKHRLAAWVRLLALTVAHPDDRSPP